MRVEVVRECHDLFDEKSGPYGFEKVGLNIEGRVVWLCGVMYPHAPKEAYETFQKWESIAEEITKRCRINAPEPSEPDDEIQSLREALANAKDWIRTLSRYALETLANDPLSDEIKEFENLEKEAIKQIDEALSGAQKEDQA